MRQLFKQLPIWYTILSLFGSLAFVLFIGYADEGFNNWHWVYDAGSWITMFIFGGVLFWFFIRVGILLKIIVKQKA